MKFTSNSVTRKKAHLLIEEPQETFSQVLEWAQQFPLVTALNSNNHMVQYGEYDWLIAVGKKALDFGKMPFDELYNHWEENRDWLFGHLSYDLKNTVENLDSKNADRHENPDILFFNPPFNCFKAIS